MKHVLLICIILLGLISTGCSKSAPACNDEKTKNIVHQLASDMVTFNLKLLKRKELTSDDINFIKENTGIRLSSIKTKEFKKDIGTYHCECVINLRMDKYELPFQVYYDSELIDNGEMFEVSINGNLEDRMSDSMINVMVMRELTSFKRFHPR